MLHAIVLGWVQHASDQCPFSYISWIMDYCVSDDSTQELLLHHGAPPSLSSKTRCQYVLGSIYTHTYIQKSIRKKDFSWPKYFTLRLQRVTDLQFYKTKTWHSIEPNLSGTGIQWSSWRWERKYRYGAEPAGFPFWCSEQITRQIGMARNTGSVLMTLFAFVPLSFRN